MTSTPWGYEGEVARTGADGRAVTLVEGANFVLCARNGDIQPDSPHGLFLLDSRFLSTFEVRIDGHPIEPLGVSIDEPAAATFFGRTEATLAVLRHRRVHQGMSEHLVVRNHATRPRPLVVTLQLDGDFADVFEVKEARVSRHGWYGRHADERTLRLGHRNENHVREAVVSFDADIQPDGRVSWTVLLGPGEEWSTTVLVTGTIDEVPVSSEPLTGLESWRANTPQLDADDPSLVRAVRRAAADLGSLRIVDPATDLAIIAAGAPWFMSPFGRDSILTAWMALLVDPELALGVLETLARFQGTEDDPATDEQPGRIFHEMRFGEGSTMALGGGRIYYGSADATPLFVMLLGELRRWGLAPDLVERLLPHADRALDWITGYGDRDGDGYVEYLRSSSGGLANQGWKDSWDGVRYADGRVAEAPIALCEVQGYTYAAYLARAHFAHEAGDEQLSRHWRDRAAALRAAFNRDFWLPERGCFAIGLDADKRPIDSRASNQGHCLWTGIVDEDKAGAVADTLLSPAMFNGWGVRTLAADEPGYNPLSYHCGSVWPHDSAIVAAGLVRYGYVGHAHRIIRGVLDVADVYDGSLPELISGIGREELSVPAAYPTSCQPQAWSAAAPLLFVRLLLRLDPWLPEGRLNLAPALPGWLSRLEIHGIPLGGGRVDVTVGGDGTVVAGLPDRTELVSRPRDALTSLGPSSGAST